MNEQIDQVMPDGKWEFDDEVASVFDNMLSRSIPQYDVMRKAVTDLARMYIQPDTSVIDLGCSRGAAIAPLIDSKRGQNRFYGIEVSKPMCAIAEEQFRDFGNVTIINTDLRTYQFFDPASVTLSVLTLQFTPIEYRQRIIQRVYNNTVEGGVFILVEKVLGATAEIDESMVDVYYGLKGENGYSPEQIERKRLSLEGVLVPVTSQWNEELLHTAGFSQVDCFWRWMNFGGWIAIK